eukprot:scaffold4079_cov250-Pinguiococcus_pyrenoidosus.AAC.8
MLCPILFSAPTHGAAGQKSRTILVQESEAERKAAQTPKLGHVRQDSLVVPDPASRGGSSSQIRLEALRSNKVCAIFLLPYAVLFIALVLDLTEPLRLKAMDLPESRVCPSPGSPHSLPMTCVEVPKLQQLTDESFMAQTTWTADVGDVGSTSFFLVERLPVVAYPDDKAGA